MQTRQQHVLLVYLVVKLADGAQFVLFAEVLLVGGSELALRKELDELVVHGSEDLLVEVDQVFVVVLQALLFVLIRAVAQACVVHTVLMIFNFINEDSP